MIVYEEVVEEAETPPRERTLPDEIRASRIQKSNSQLDFYPRSLPSPTLILPPPPAQATASFIWQESVLNVARLAEIKGGRKAMAAMNPSANISTAHATTPNSEAPTPPSETVDPDPYGIKTLDESRISRRHDDDTDNPFTQKRKGSVGGSSVGSCRSRLSKKERMAKRTGEYCQGKDRPLGSARGPMRLQGLKIPDEQFRWLSRCSVLSTNCQLTTSEHTSGEKQNLTAAAAQLSFVSTKNPFVDATVLSHSTSPAAGSAATAAINSLMQR